jgi:hypothetical protein
MDADLGGRTEASGVSTVDGRGQAEASCSFNQQDRTHEYVIWVQAETLQEGIGGGNRTHELGQLNFHERQFNEMDAMEALGALDEAVIEEVVQLTTDPLPFGLGKWLNKGGAE